MALQQPTSPLQVLIEQLPKLFSDKDAEWLGDAAFALSLTAAEAVAGIISLPQEAKCRFVEKQLEATGGSGGFGWSMQYWWASGGIHWCYAPAGQRQHNTAAGTAWVRTACVGLTACCQPRLQQLHIYLALICWLRHWHSAVQPYSLLTTCMHPCVGTFAANKRIAVLYLTAVYLQQRRLLQLLAVLAPVLATTDGRLVFFLACWYCQ